MRQREPERCLRLCQAAFGDVGFNLFNTLDGAR